MLGGHLVLVTLYRGLRVVLSKTKLESVTLNIIFSVVSVSHHPGISKFEGATVLCTCNLWSKP